MSDAAPQAPDERERTADASQGEAALRWRVVAASVTGTSHAKTGLPCQDSHSIGGKTPDDLLIAAVADGAGSAALSDTGSEIAARTATRTVARLARLHIAPFYEAIIKEILEGAVRAARAALETEARQQERALRDFATTLIVAICTPDMTAAAQIGDGAAVTSHEDEYTLFSAPQRGEYANQTNFITSHGWQDTLQISAQRGGIRRLAMFTDGIQSISLNAAASNTPHAPFFDPLFNWAEKQESEQTAGNSLKNFLSSSRVTDRTDDDLTLLLAILS